MGERPRTRPRGGRRRKEQLGFICVCIYIYIYIYMYTYIYISPLTWGPDRVKPMIRHDVSTKTGRTPLQHTWRQTLTMTLSMVVPSVSAVLPFCRFGITLPRSLTFPASRSAVLANTRFQLFFKLSLLLLFMFRLVVLSIGIRISISISIIFVLLKTNIIIIMYLCLDLFCLWPASAPVSRAVLGYRCLWTKTLLRRRGHVGDLLQIIPNQGPDSSFCCRIAGQKGWHTNNIFQYTMLYYTILYHTILYHTIL